MRIGYPCINRSIGCTANHTFRLASYSDERLIATVNANLTCLEEILAWNLDHGLLAFRIGSGFVPFASHPVCTAPWREACADRFAEVGAFIRRHGIRISMHPDQFNILNAKDTALVERTVAELTYHAEVLDLFGLDATAKVQIHIGGVYADHENSMSRFVETYRTLDPRLRHRLVSENDDGRYTAADCLAVSDECGVPVVLDVFHHAVFGDGRPLGPLLDAVASTWMTADGPPMVDYSSQAPGRRRGVHAASLEDADFGRFLAESTGRDVDLMLEIKDKEESALRALALAAADPRLRRGPVSYP
jgi:UV DNA damage endonuclease